MTTAQIATILNSDANANVRLWTAASGEQRWYINHPLNILAPDYDDAKRRRGVTVRGGDWFDSANAFLMAVTTASVWIDAAGAVRSKNSTNAALLAEALTGAIAAVVAAHTELIAAAPACGTGNDIAADFDRMDIADQMIDLRVYQTVGGL